MKIKILTGCYYPEVHPRAFRATELAKEFIHRGYHVEIINMTTVEGFDYDEYYHKYNIRVINLGINKIGAENKLLNHRTIRFPFIDKTVKSIAHYLFNGRFIKQVSLMMPKLNSLDGADLVIALSTPFICLYVLSKYVEKNGKHFLTIADSGDPFYYSKQYKRAIWFKYIEKRVYKSFDYLCIPTENAIPLYSPLIPIEKIRIIPQGFNFKNIKVYSGKIEGPIKFAYAGVFYWDIRNPEFLFEYLNSLKQDFSFYMYMRNPDINLNTVLKKYQNLRNKIVINYNVPHDDLVYELSQMHFLINIENISNTQIPSKLIDYGIAGRPIFSCKKDNFSKNQLTKFLEGDYTGKLEVNIEDYDIEHIVNQIMKLT